MHQVGSETLLPPRDISVSQWAEENVALTGSGAAERGQWQLEVERCRNEIACIEAHLRAGHPDVEGLMLALADWSQELRMIEREKKESAGG